MPVFHVVSEPPRVIRVLIAEDNQTVANQVARLLESAPTAQFVLDFAENLTTTLAALAENRYHVVLLDLGLPDSEGLQTFMRVHQQAPDVPTVVCTGMDSENLALEALRRGAQDYLVKGQMDRMTLIKSVLFAVERKHAADKLRESEEKHRSLLEAIPDIVCKVDVEGSIVFANQAVASLGYEPEELIGAPLSRIVHHEDIPRVEARVTRRLARASVPDASEFATNLGVDTDRGPFEVRYVSKAGEEVPVDFSVAVLRNRRGEVTGIVGIARDMTEMRRLISDLETSQEQLRQRTAQLIHTEKMTALGELAGGVAHEANQPLNAIKLACGEVMRDIAKDRLDHETLHETVRDVVGQIDKLAELVQHMADFSRRTGGGRRMIDAAVPVEGVIKLIGEQLRVEGLRLVVEVERGLRVRANAVRLEQVLMNVVRNARDAVSANPPGGPRKISLRVLSPGDAGAERYVTYEVSDTGPGIPQELRGKVFEPFFTTKRQGEGTGLGLSIAEQIVAEHEGRIELECPPGQGTTVRILIPSP